MATTPLTPTTPQRGFVAQLPPQPIATETIENAPFWPAISTTAVRESLRLEGTVTPTRLRDALVAAMAHVNAELSHWAAEQRALGWDKLADVPAERINGTSTRTHAYLRAVYHAARAELEETKRAQGTLPGGMGKDARVLEAVGQRHDDAWQIVRQAIADCMGRPREVVELI